MSRSRPASSGRDAVGAAEQGGRAGVRDRLVRPGSSEVQLDGVAEHAGSR